MCGRTGARSAFSVTGKGLRWIVNLQLHGGSKVYLYISRIVSRPGTGSVCVTLRRQLAKAPPRAGTQGLL